MIGEIIRVRIPGGDTHDLVWCLQISRGHIVALEDHHFNKTDYPTGTRWSHGADCELQAQLAEPPDHVLAAAMRLTLEGKLKCAD